MCACVYVSVHQLVHVCDLIRFDTTDESDDTWNEHLITGRGPSSVFDIFSFVPTKKFTSCVKC
jgi:hypothetical protein